jgi:hypothetical protein
MSNSPLRPLNFPRTSETFFSPREQHAIFSGFRIGKSAGLDTKALAHVEALYLFAERIGENESVWLEASSSMSAPRCFVITAGTSMLSSDRGLDGQSFVDRFSDLREALLLTFPSFELVELERAQIHESSKDWRQIAQRGLPVRIPDLAGMPDPALLATPHREEALSKQVVLGACASPAALSDALRILRQARQPLTIRLRLTPRRLTSPEIRKMSELYQTLTGLRNSQLLTGLEIKRVGDTAALVAAWLTAKGGVALDLSVYSDPPIGEALISALGAAFSLPASARRDGADSSLDLSGCFVRGQQLPAFTLDPDVSRHLAPVGGGRATGSGSVLTGALSEPLGVTSDLAPVWLDDRSRSRHLIVCGATGTGKSTLIKNLIASDLRTGHGVVLIDPHGDLFDDVLSQLSLDLDIPVWVADTANLDSPYTLNLLQSAGDSYRQNFVCNQLIRLLKNSLYKDVPEGFGPMFEAYFRNAFMLLSDGGGGKFTISDMDRVFGDARFRRELLESCRNEHVCRFWRDIATKAGGDAALENVAPYIVSKLTQFVGNPVIGPIVCARESTIDFNEILDSGGVCIVNLAKGRVGTTEAQIMGGIFTTALFSAALARSGQSREQRRPVRVYLDEFQSYAGEVISEMLAECRKYGLEMTLATQSLNRLKVLNEDLMQSVLGNSGNIIALRSGPQDADILADWIGGGITRENITSLDDFHAIGRLLDSGRVSHPIAFRLAENALA